MNIERTRLKLATALIKGAQGIGRWLRFQSVEISKEVRRAARPPVRVRRQPGGAIAIIAKPEFGGMTTVLPVHEAAQVRVAPPEVMSLISATGYAGDSDALVSAWNDRILASDGASLWARRSAEFVAALVPALVALRDQGSLIISEATLRRFEALQNTVELAQREDVPAVAKTRLNTLLTALPGFKWDKGAMCQSSTASEQFSYLTMYAFSALNSGPAPAGVDVRSYHAGGAGPGLLIGSFPDESTARHSIELISNVLIGGRGVGRMAFGAITAVLGLAFVAALVRPPATAKSVPDATGAPQQIEAPAADVMRDAFGFGGSANEAPASMPGAPAAAKGESLADQIYAQAMAAAERSSYEAGPPQSPIENPNVADFGLGGSSKAGCDPALKFTVASAP